jgi:hypothetical protein
MSVETDNPKNLPYISSNDRVLAIIESGRLPNHYLDRFFTGSIVRAVRRIRNCGLEWNKWANEWLSGGDLTKVSADKATDVATGYFCKQPNARFLSAKWTAIAASCFANYEYVKAQRALMQAAAFGEWLNGKAMEEENNKQLNSISIFTKEMQS